MPPGCVDVRFSVGDTLFCKVERKTKKRNSTHSSTKIKVCGASCPMKRQPFLRDPERLGKRAGAIARVKLTLFLVLYDPNVDQAPIYGTLWCYSLFTSRALRDISTVIGLTSALFTFLSPQRNSRQRHQIVHRYGLFGRGRKSTPAVAAVMGVSRQYVGRVHQIALNK